MAGRRCAGVGAAVGQLLCVLRRGRSGPWSGRSSVQATHRLFVLFNTLTRSSEKAHVEYGVRAVQPAPLLLAEAPVVVAVAELDWPMYTFDKGRFERGGGREPDDPTTCTMRPLKSKLPTIPLCVACLSALMYPYPPC